jgi:hypothetical protein
MPLLIRRKDSIQCRASRRQNGEKGYAGCAVFLTDDCQQWDSNPRPFGPVPETGALDQLGHIDLMSRNIIIYL